MTVNSPSHCLWDKVWQIRDFSHLPCCPLRMFWRIGQRSSSPTLAQDHFKIWNCYCNTMWASLVQIPAGCVQPERCGWNEKSFIWYDESGCQKQVWRNSMYGNTNITRCCTETAWINEMAVKRSCFCIATRAWQCCLIWCLTQGKTQPLIVLSDQSYCFLYIQKTQRHTWHTKWISQTRRHEKRNKSKTVGEVTHGTWWLEVGERYILSLYETYPAIMLHTVSCGVVGSS